MRDAPHPVVILSFALISLVAIIFNNSSYNFLFILITTHLFLFFFKLRLARFFLSIFIASLMGGSIFIITILFPAKDISTDIFGIALLNFLKIGSLIMISFNCAALIDIERMIVFFMQKKIVSVFLGYPIMIALNSIANIKEEIERLLVIKKFRDIKGYNIMQISIPILVFAIKESQRSATALIARNLTESKTYLHNYKLSGMDLFIILIFVTATLLINFIH